MTLDRFELADRGDVMRLVNLFYDRVQADELLGPIFNEVAHVDWATHLLLMYDFWDSVLFSVGTFHGNPLLVHRALARLTPLTGREFDRWVALFEETIDDLFVAAMADHAKECASRIAATLRQNLGVAGVIGPQMLMSFSREDT
jgi:hemoglobin